MSDLIPSKILLDRMEKMLRKPEVFARMQTGLRARGIIAVPVRKAFEEDFPNWSVEAPTVGEVKAKLNELGETLDRYVVRLTDNDLAGFLFGGPERELGNWLDEWCRRDKE
jgi:hypothetical protein